MLVQENGKEIKMTKQEVCNQIVEDMLDAGMLNEVDFPNVTLLQKEVEQMLKKHLEDYALVYKVGILID